MKRQRLQFFPIWLTVLIDFLGLAIVVPIFAPMLLDTTHGILPTDWSLTHRGILLGFLIAVYPLAQFIGSPVLGKLSDRHGRKPWLILSLGGTCIGYVLTALGVDLLSITWVFIGRGLCGFMGGSTSICQSAVADFSIKGSKAAYFGYLALAMGLGFVLGPVVGGKLADPHVVSWFNYDIPFWFSAILSLFNMFLMVFLFRETIVKKGDGKINIWKGLEDIGRAFKDGHIRGTLAVFFFFVMGWFFFAQFFQVYLIQRFDYDPRQIGDTYTYIAIWYAVLQGAVAGPVSKRVAADKIALVCLPLLALVLLTLLLPQSPFWLYFIFPFIVLFVCLSWPNIMALVSNAASEEKQGEILGINQSLQSLAQGITPIASGPLIAHYMELPTIIAAICSALAFVILFLIRKRVATHVE